MRTLTTGCGGLLVVFLMPLNVQAQAPSQRDIPPLTSNRPGIGDSEALVASGVFQLEAGGQLEEAPPGGDLRWKQTWGQLTIRYGLSRRIEIFGGWDGFSLDRVLINGTSRVVVGGNDLRLGTKLALLTEEAHGLTLTIAPAWSFPLGSEEFTSGSEDPSFRVLWARSLPRDWSISGNLLWLRTSDTIGRYWDTSVTVGVTRGLTESFSVFVEGSNVLQAIRPDSLTIDGGIAWVVRTDLQLDLSAGHTLHNRGDDWFASAGITLRRRPVSRPRPVSSARPDAATRSPQPERRRP
jgi:Putative MetA-pathway of phenol degradation